MKKKPLISIIMNCYNGEKYLEKSLQSIKKQTYSNWELIFWDNISSDKSKKIFEKFKDKRFFYYSSKKFLNLYNARNHALKKAKGQYICFLDVDDLWVKNKLDKQIRFLIKNNEFQIIYSNFYVILENKKKIFTKYKKGTLPGGYITQELLNEYSVGILTTMISRKVFKFIKFKNKYNIIGDFDFIIRSSFKYKIGCIQEPLAYYRVHNFNYSKIKTKLHIKELSKWILDNARILEKMSLSTIYIKKNIFKLRVKNYLKFLGV
jgi:glycosyltransferase involved in cell wall biosynthesis